MLHLQEFRRESPRLESWDESPSSSTFSVWHSLRCSPRGSLCIRRGMPAPIPGQSATFGPPTETRRYPVRIPHVGYRRYIPKYLRIRRRTPEAPRKRRDRTGNDGTGRETTGPDVSRIGVPAAWPGQHLVGVRTVPIPPQRAVARGRRSRAISIIPSLSIIGVSIDVYLAICIHTVIGVF